MQGYWHAGVLSCPVQSSAIAGRFDLIECHSSWNETMDMLPEEDIHELLKVRCGYMMKNCKQEGLP